MEKFKVIYQNETKICFKLNIDKEMFVFFEVFTSGKWTYLSGKKQWNLFSLKNGNFGISRVGIGETITLQEFMLINDGFHELMRQLKEDSSYRLKVMQLLNAESRKVWNKV